MASKRSVLLALTDTREHGWHLVAEMIHTARFPVGWRGDGILSFIGDREDLAEFILSSDLPAVDLSLVRNEINLLRANFTCLRRTSSMAPAFAQ
jgi:hypothetical protein